MITARRTRLFRVPDLSAFRTILTTWIGALPVIEARDTAVIVPTRAAAEQLRRTVEDRVLGAQRPSLAWPMLVTRRELYDELGARLTTPRAMLSSFEREVILAAAARRAAADGLPPPFHIRPGLVAEMLALYDHIRRLGRSVDDFDRNVREELEPLQDVDRGARRLLQQTRFLAATFRSYVERTVAADRFDEHALRDVLVAERAARPVVRVVVTVADRVAEAEGLWPADLVLLSRLQALSSVDILCTESLIASGLLERLHGAFPDLEEERSPLTAHATPTVIVPRPASPIGSATLAFVHRDREEELAAIARRVKLDRQSGRAAPVHRTAVVVRRPLPYLYLARDVFTGAGIPFEALDTLPLAAEPYAAALDVVLDAVATDFTRASLLALARSPHFSILGESGSAPAIAALDVALADARYPGGLDRLRTLARSWAAAGVPASREERRRQTALPALTALLDAVADLQPLAERRTLIDQVATLTAWLHRHDRGEGGARNLDALEPGRRRVRAAVLGALASLALAYRRHDPAAEGDIADLVAAIRRWLGSQTFAARQGEPGLQIVDAQAARYGDFDDVQIVGLIDGDWPERVRRTVLYPSSLMALLEPLPAAGDPARRERDGWHAARAAFKDLVLSARTRVRLSTFTLEHDAVVEPSLLLDDVAGLGLSQTPADERVPRVSSADALTMEPRVPSVVPAPAGEWAALRLEVRDPAAPRGAAGSWRLPRVSVSRLERYLDCPFRFYASEVLRLQEQPEDEDTRTPLERGRFLHELWERFFSAWQAAGHGRIHAEDVNDARELFEHVCEEAIAAEGLSPAEAALERIRLLGSATSPGIAHRVFAMEADRPGRIDRRLMEFPLQGDFAFRTREGASRTVTLSAKVDRIDVLADRRLRVIDYKSKKTPDVKQALQLPVYSDVARQALAADGEPWAIAEALYLSFEGDKAVVPLQARNKTLDVLLAEAQERLLTTLDRIAEGRFPPSPARKSLCAPCPYRAVCRLEIVDRDQESPDE